LKKKILVSTPDPGALKRVLEEAGSRQVHWVYLGQSILEHRRVSDQFRGQGKFIDTTNQFHGWTQKLREPYLKYLFDIGRELDSLSWWLTPASWRNSFVSSAFRQACHLKTGLEIAVAWDRPEPLVLVADAPVCRSIQKNIGNDPDNSVAVYGVRRRNPLSSVFDTLGMLGRRAVFVIRELSQIFQSRRTHPRPARPDADASLLISWGTTASLLRGGEFHQFFFGDLADRLADHDGRVVIVPMILKGVGYKKALEQLKDSRLPLCLPHSLFGIMDPLKAAVSSLRKPARPKRILEFSGMDVAPLFEPELRQYWISNQSAAQFMMTLLVRRWAKWSPSIARIIYMYENQPWERAICWQAKRSLPDAKLMGYSPTPVSKFLLNFFLAPGEAQIAPLPDRIVTVGEQPARLFSSDGYDPETVKVGGALRMQDLKSLGSSEHKRPPAQDRFVLVAPSLGLNETEELAYMAAHLFDEDAGVRVVLKCHPMLPFERVSESIGTPLPPHVQTSDEPIQDLILKSSVMIYSSSTVCIDALALGVPVVNLRPRFDIGLDPLEDFPDLRPEATGLADLREKVHWILEHIDEHNARRRDGWARLAADMYSPVTPESIEAFF